MALKWKKLHWNGGYALHNIYIFDVFFLCLTIMRLRFCYFYCAVVAQKDKGGGNLFRIQ